MKASIYGARLALRTSLALILLVALVAPALTAATSVVAQAAADSASVGAGATAVDAAEIEVLRRLLGLPPSERVAEPATQVTVEPIPATVEVPSPGSFDEPEPPKPRNPPTVMPASTQPAPASKPAAAEKSARPATKAAPRRPASPQPRTAKSPDKGSPSTVRGATSGPMPAAEDAGPKANATTVAQPPAAGSEPAAIAGVGVPRAGTVVSLENVEQWKHLLGPSVQWSIERGASLAVIDPKPMPLEDYRAAATQRYHHQVRLADDKRSLQNYVAGIPFPFVAEDDAGAASKMMFNMEHRIAQDDMDVRNFSCDTGELDKNRGFSTQRHYMIEHFRRLYYTSRFHNDPQPTWRSQDGARYREMLYPLREPFDLKGAGFTYIRYLDPGRQDDSWLYFPQMKRIRRLSTAQRSEGVFGQDVDLDSYGGFAGNPAWTNWSYLGTKTILASMHARRSPSQFQAAPADFFPDDVWEPREVYVILGVSQLGGYNFGRRVIYLDSESWLIPYTEIYDLKGGLWRSLIQNWKQADRPRPNATRAIYATESVFINAFTLIDMQQEHATRCQFPSPDMPEEDGWYYNFGPSEGTTEEEFSVSNIVGTGR